MLFPPPPPPTPRAPIDEGSKKVVVISNDVTTVDGLAVDWLYNHIYWTNTDTDTIEVRFISLNST